VHILTNMQRVPTEGNFYDEQGKAQKPVIVRDYNWHIGYVNKGERMANSYSVSWRMCTWLKYLFSYPLDITVQNNYIILLSCSSQIAHRKYLVFVKNLLETTLKKPHSQSTPRQRLNPQTSQWYDLKDYNLDIGQLQDQVCGVMCTSKHKCSAA